MSFRTMVEIRRHPPQGSKLKKILSSPDGDQLKKYTSPDANFYLPVCVMYMTQLTVWRDQDFTN